jgi:hypothetical protein
MHCWSKALCAAETWILLEVDKKYWRVLKCDAGEGWIRSVAPTEWEMKYCIESRGKGISYIQ